MGVPQRTIVCITAINIRNFKFLTKMQNWIFKIGYHLK